MLIELLIVIVVFGRVFFLGKKSVRMPFGTNKVAQAEVQMRNMAMAVEMYLLSNRGRLPASLEVLAKPDPRTDEPFLSRIPLDPWKRAYAFKQVGRRHFEIRSAGKDGTLQTDDDVIWPKPERRTRPRNTRKAIAVAETQMANIAQAVEMHMLSTRGKLPIDLEALTKEDPATGEPYMHRMPKDPWGEAYALRKLDRRKFEIVSKGPDKQLGTEDDVVWPKPEDK